jgi:hypothetical protein
MALPEKTAASYLLSDLDPLPYPRRMREIAESARDFAGRGALRSVLEELESGGPYERGVAIVLACAAGDAEWTGARLADPDSYVRGHALRAAESHGVPDAAFEAALDDAPEAVRRQLLRAIVAGNRTALADRLIGTLRREWGDAEAARLLPGCSDGVEGGPAPRRRGTGGRYGPAARGGAPPSRGGRPCRGALRRGGSRVPGGAGGWPDPWRELLTSLRAHGVPDVRDAALSVSMSYESRR